MWRWGCSFLQRLQHLYCFNYGVFELDVCGIMRRSGWSRCSVYGALGLDVYGVYRVCIVSEVFWVRRLWRSLRL